jgi:hypothetical protein
MKNKARVNTIATPHLHNNIVFKIPIKFQIKKLILKLIF